MNTPADFPYTTDVPASELVRASVPDQIRYAIYNGYDRPSEILGVVPVGETLARTKLEQMVEDDRLTERYDGAGMLLAIPDDVSTTTAVAARAEPESMTKASTSERPGDDTVSGPEASDEDVASAMSEHGGMLPVDRDYDWDEHRLDEDTVAEYVEADTEYSDMLKEIRDRDVTGKLPRFRWTGPTGCGKTTAGENAAVDLDAPCFFVECHDGLRPNNLLGMPTYVGDETWWVDGPIVKALIASRLAEREDTDFDEVVLVFDEVNRTTSRTLGVIMSALDHRANVTLNARGGETVQGVAENLVTFATMNEGDNYVVNNIDVAQLRRFGNTFEADYIGQYDLDREAELVSDRTPVSHDVAVEMIRAANAIRDQAGRQKSNVGMGLPTSSCLDWARTAWSYRDDDPDGGPLMKAAHRTFLNTFYSDDEFDTVRTAIESHVRGLDVGESETDESIGGASASDETFDTSIDVDDDSFLLCDTCGFYQQVEACDDEVAMTMECPDCGDALTPKEAR